MSYRPLKKRTVWNPVPSRSVNDEFLLRDLDGVVETLSTDETTHSSSTFRLHNLNPVASYSWIEGTPPVIAVPGVPDCQNINDLTYITNARLSTNLEEHYSVESSS